MKNRLTLLTLVPLLFAACKAQTPPSATLHLSLQHLKEANAELCPNGELSFIAPYGEIPLTAGPDGKMEIVVPLENGPEYFLLFRNPLYLSPGDELTIDLYDDNLKTVIAPEGRGVEANTYLKLRYYPKSGSFLDGGDLLQGESRPIGAVLDSLADARLGQLEELQGVTEEFREMERVRIKADYVNSLLLYPNYKSDMIPMEATKEEYLNIVNGFYASHRERIQPVLDELVSDDKYLNIEVVRQVLSRFRGVPGLEVRGSERFNALVDISGQVRNIHADITSEQYSALLDYGERIPYPDMKAIYMEKLNASTRLREGMPAIEVALRDPQGRSLRLSDLKGKPMYVDIWATWCAPCMAESPSFQALSEEYPGIRFVAVSVDGDIPAWEKYVRGGDHKAVVEVLATDDMRKNWDIAGIPRFLLIDAGFRIISADAPRPSQGDQIRPILDKLSGR